MGGNFVQFAGDLPAKVVEVEIVLVVLERIFAERGGIGLGKRVRYMYIKRTFRHRSRGNQVRGMQQMQLHFIRHQFNTKEGKRNTHGIVNHLYAEYI